MSERMTRRTLLASIGAAGVFPSLASAITAAEPSPAPQSLKVQMQVTQPESGTGGWRHVLVRGGTVSGFMQGIVQSGRLQWLVDPASGAVEVTARVQLLRSDGLLVELHDRTVHAAPGGVAGLPGVCTSPQLFDAAGRSLAAPALAGRLDASGLARGIVTLRAFERG